MEEKLERELEKESPLSDIAEALSEKDEVELSALNEHELEPSPAEADKAKC